MRLHINCRIILSLRRSDLKKLLMTPVCESRADWREAVRRASGSLSRLTNSRYNVAYANKLTHRVLCRGQTKLADTERTLRAIQCAMRTVIFLRMNTLYLVLAFSLISAQRFRHACERALKETVIYWSVADSACWGIRFRAVTSSLTAHTGRRNLFQK